MKKKFNESIKNIIKLFNDIKFDKNLVLIYKDIRKFGYLELIKKPLDIVSFKDIGLEPFLCRSFEKELFLKMIL